VRKEKLQHERTMKESVIVRQSCLRRWFIARACEQRLALSGSRWIEHIDGVGLDRNVSTFHSPNEARCHAEKLGFLVACAAQRESS
jgi:hypothetical protein